MRKIIFYIDNEWALGSIHIELIKQFYLKGINSYLLSWNKQYTQQELLELNDDCDYIVTTPHGYINLRQISQFQIPQNKFIVIAHATLELNDWISHHRIDESNFVHSFGVVSNFLREKSIELGIPKIPKVCMPGINFQSFYAPVRSSLSTVGYGSTFWDRNSLPQVYANQPAAKKRGYLAKEAASAAGLDFRVAQTYHNSFVTMPGYYRKIDCVIMCSSEEGAGMPVLEGGAAGCLVISTPVGHCLDRATNRGADIVPVDETEFMKHTIDLLKSYQADSIKYQNRCIEIQEHARSYDWKYTIDSWISLL